MRYAPEGEEEPASVRRLRVMVMVMMFVLMAGIVTIAGTIVIRLGFGGGPSSVPATEFSVPKGKIVGLGRGEGTVMMVIEDKDGVERLHVFDAAAGGKALSVTELKRK